MGSNTNLQTLCPLWDDFVFFCQKCLRIELNVTNYAPLCDIFGAQKFVTYKQMLLTLRKNKGLNNALYLINLSHYDT